MKGKAYEVENCQKIRSELSRKMKLWLASQMRRDLLYNLGVLCVVCRKLVTFRIGVQEDASLASDVLKPGANR